MYSGIMPQKGVSASKQITMKGNKKAQSLSFEAIKSSSSNGDLYQYPTKGKVDIKDEKATKRKKEATQEKTPPRGSKRKNLITYPPHLP